MTVPPSGPSGPPPSGGYQPWLAQGMAGPSPEERNWAMTAHGGTLIAASFAMGFLCPLVIMLVKGKESAYIRRHAVESLNFQISLLIYLVISAILVLVLIGFVMLAAVGIFALVVIILATITAAHGRDYRYPLTIRLVS